AAGEPSPPAAAAPTNPGWPFNSHLLSFPLMLGLRFRSTSKRQITKPSLRKAGSVLRRWAFLPPPGWKLEMPGKKLQNSPKKSEHILSSLVIGRKGRWHDGGSGLSAVTWSSVSAAAS